MSYSSESNLLLQLSRIVKLDVDSMDPGVASRFPGIVFNNMTSNQIAVHSELVRPENAGLAEEGIRYALELHGTRQLDDSTVQDALDCIGALLAKRVYPSVTGNVLLQISPSKAFDTVEVVNHAKKLVALCEAHGMARSRICIKIPLTPQSAIACQELSDSGIQTLGTVLFSVPQAMAASQAGCAFISPYFTEFAMYADSTRWIEYQHTAKEHPMARVIQSIRRGYLETDSKTKVMPASIYNVKEAVALASLRPDHLTISAAILDQLHSLPEVPPEQLETPPFEPITNASGTDYLQNDGDKLKRALEHDTETSRKIKEALAAFDATEKQSKIFLLSYKLKAVD